MTKREGKTEIIDVKGLLERDEDFLRSAVEGLVHAALEAEMTEAVGAAKSECLVPRCAGVMYAKLQREGLWDKFYMDAPARQRQCVEQYNIVKRA